VRRNTPRTECLSSGVFAKASEATPSLIYRLGHRIRTAREIRATVVCCRDGVDTRGQRRSCELCRALPHELQSFRMLVDSRSRKRNRLRAVRCVIRKGQRPSCRSKANGSERDIDITVRLGLTPFEH
jgi:hypothetical protein